MKKIPFLIVTLAFLLYTPFSLAANNIKIKSMVKSNYRNFLKYKKVCTDDVIQLCCENPPQNDKPDYTNDNDNDITGIVDKNPDNDPADTDSSNCITGVTDKTPENDKADEQDDDGITGKDGLEIVEIFTVDPNGDGMVIQVNPNDDDDGPNDPLDDDKPEYTFDNGPKFGRETRTNVQVYFEIYTYDDTKFEGDSHIYVALRDQDDDPIVKLKCGPGLKGLKSLAFDGSRYELNCEWNRILDVDDENIKFISVSAKNDLVMRINRTRVIIGENNYGVQNYRSQYCIYSNDTDIQPGKKTSMSGGGTNSHEHTIHSYVYDCDKEGYGYTKNIKHNLY